MVTNENKKPEIEALERAVVVAAELLCVDRGIDCEFHIPPEYRIEFKIWLEDFYSLRTAVRALQEANDAGKP